MWQAAPPTCGISSAPPRSRCSRVPGQSWRVRPQARELLSADWLPPPSRTPSHPGQQRRVCTCWMIPPQAGCHVKSIHTHMCVSRCAWDESLRMSVSCQRLFALTTRPAPSPPAPAHHPAGPLSGVGAGLPGTVAASDDRHLCGWHRGGIHAAVHGCASPRLAGRRVELAGIHMRALRSAFGWVGTDVCRLRTSPAWSPRPLLPSVTRGSWHRLWDADSLRLPPPAPRMSGGSGVHGPATGGVPCAAHAHAHVRVTMCMG